MEKNVFNSMLQQLRNKKTDIMFNPKELDRLNDNERKYIEEQLLMFCLRENKTAYRYIPYFKTINIEEELSEAKLEKFPERDRAEIYYYLYLRSRNFKYLNKVILMSETELTAYSLLTFMYMDKNTDEEVKKIIYDSLVIVKDSINSSKKEIYDKMFNRILKNNSSNIRK